MSGLKKAIMDAEPSRRKQCDVRFKVYVAHLRELCHLVGVIILHNVEGVDPQKFQPELNCHTYGIFDGLWKTME
jgi:hypothetical protein